MINDLVSTRIARPFRLCLINQQHHIWFQTTGKKSAVKGRLLHVKYLDRFGFSWSHELIKLPSSDFASLSARHSNLHVNWVYTPSLFSRSMHLFTFTHSLVCLNQTNSCSNPGTAVPREDWQHLFGSQGADEATVVTIDSDYANGYNDTQISRQGSRPLSKRPSLSGPILSTTRTGRDSAYSSQNVTPSAAAQRGVTSLSRAGSQAGEDGEKRPRQSLTLKRVSDGQNEEENGRERTPSAEKKSRWLRTHPVDRGLAVLNDDEESGTMSRNRLGKATPGRPSELGAKCDCSSSLST